jgi:hypothetical protein
MLETKAVAPLETRRRRAGTEAIYRDLLTFVIKPATATVLIGV